MNRRKYLEIVAACERYLEQHGDSYLGVGWTKSQKDADTRYEVMLGVIEAAPAGRVSLLDFGCGASHLYDHIRKHGYDHIEYTGLDLSDRFLEVSRRKHPDVTYYRIDICEDPDAVPEFDYIVMNGVFTARFEVGLEDALANLKAIVGAVFRKARIGIAFNVMSKHVEWEREDLLHLPLSDLAEFLVKDVSRHFTIRHDYGLYEYTTYVYRQSTAS